jgi:hypothetical protein
MLQHDLKQLMYRGEGVVLDGEGRLKVARPGSLLSLDNDGTGGGAARTELAREQVSVTAEPLRNVCARVVVKDLKVRFLHWLKTYKQTAVGCCTGCARAFAC